MPAPAQAAQARPATEHGDLILVESDSLWVLTARFDPRLTVGAVFELAGELWTVTWESDHGFGRDAVN